MKKIGAWIRKKPVISFYIICFLLTWTLWIPAMLSRTMLSEILAVVGVTGGPALTGVFIARVVSSPTDRPPSMPFWQSFVLGWGVCGIAFGLNNYLSGNTSLLGIVIISAVFALIPAFVLAFSISGHFGIRRTLATLVHPRGWWGWYVLSVVLPLFNRLVSARLSNVLGFKPLANPSLPSSSLELAGTLIVIFLYTLIYAGGLNEETGWTGFALHRMLAKTNPLLATIFVWGLWMLWHVPMHLAGYFNLSAHLLIGSFFGRFLMTYLFIRSSGGILTALLLHTTINVTSQFVPVTNASLFIDAATAMMVIVAGRMWQKLPENDPAIMGVITD